MRQLKVSISELLFTLFIYAIGIFIVGFSIFPGALLCFKILHASAGLAVGWGILALCFGAIAGYLIYGISLIFISGALRWLFHLNLKEGEYPRGSAGAFKWVLANSLVLIVSTTFMDFILLTPLINLFYRFMGAKLGKSVQINSKNCSDLSLLEIGDNAVIGGHATVIGHSVERGRLILKKVKIGKNVTIGLNSVVLPGTEIGDGATIAAGAVLVKNTFVEPGSVYAGVPAVKVTFVTAAAPISC